MTSKRSPFIVVDTEGYDCLKEVAVIDAKGNLIYEAFVEGEDYPITLAKNIKPLVVVLQEFFQLAQNQTVVFHSAQHDQKVLKKSCHIARIPWQPIRIDCTFELAKKKEPGLISYSLEFLSKKFQLKVDGKIFNVNAAHTARYDAQFTHQLYLYLTQKDMVSQKSEVTNPFSSSRVDNPFQDHADNKNVYQSEFEKIKLLINDIRQDKNHQTKGIVVIGEPGSGKTHLMMRLAKEILQVNRLLFVRHPNNAHTILYHIYTRVLESFVYQVPGSNYTQLEFLLAHSFTKLISQTGIIQLTQRDQDIINSVHENPLNLYERLGEENSQKKRAYWEHIEKRTHQWWMNQYGVAGAAPKIINGIIKFCRYQDQRYKDLVARWLAVDILEADELDILNLNDWQEEMSKENFSLEALSVLSKLSLLDEPLVVVFDQLEMLGLPQNRTILENFGEAIKEIFTHVPNCLIILNLFPDRWQQIQSFWDASIVERVAQYQVQLQPPSMSEMRHILELKAQSANLKLSEIFDEIEIQTLCQQKSIRSLINRASDLYLNKISSRLQPIASVRSPVIANEESSLRERVNQLEIEFTSLKKQLHLLGMGLMGHFASDPSTMVVKTATGIDQDESIHDLNSEVTPEIQTIKKFLAEQRYLYDQEYSNIQIISDSDDIGKLQAIVEAASLISPIERDYLRLGKKRLPEHILIKTVTQSVAIAFLNLSGAPFTNCIKNFNELVILNPQIQFYIWRDARQPAISQGAKVGRVEIEKHNNAPNGSFQIMTQEDRLSFELLYRLINAIYNQDIDVPLLTAWPIACEEFSKSWLVQLLS